MGPEGEPQTLPARPRFTWDIRNVPWTDGKGDQSRYAQAVQHWCAFHDNLNPLNSNRIEPKNRGIVLLSNLFGHASDVCRTITQDVIDSPDGTFLVVNAVHKKDALSVVSEVYDQLMSLFRTIRRNGENFRTFEARFNAQLHKFNALGQLTSLSEALSALLLLANADVDNAQRISILAAAAPANVGLTPRSSTDDFITAVRYEAIASVIRLCDGPTPTSFADNPSHQRPQQALAAYQPESERPRQQRYQQHAPRQQQPSRYMAALSREQIRAAKNANACVRCGNFGHWYADHNQDGSLHPGCVSRAAPIGDAPVAPVQPRRAPRAPVAPPAVAAPNDGADAPDNAVAFNMAFCSPSPVQTNVSTVPTKPHERVGPMLDNGAPYSAIGYSDLCSLSTSLFSQWTGDLEPIPHVFSSCPYWQYGTGEHRSEARVILGSVVLSAYATNGTPLLIRHLVLEGSSQWVVGRNVTSRSDIVQIDDSCLRTCGTLGQRLRLPLLDVRHHLYLPLAIFLPPAGNIHALSASTVSPSAAPLEWSVVKPIVDRVHAHVCGHSSYSDMKLLLERTGHWDDAVAGYLHQLIARCNACRLTARPKPSRKVSLSSLHRNFNDVVCIDHFFLDGLRIFHAMDSATRYSAGLVTSDLTLSAAVNALEAVWIAPFWNPCAIQADGAFQHPEFTDHLESLGVSMRPVPPRRHSKNVLESKHGVIRSIFLRLLDFDAQLSPQLAAQRSIRISNDLYGSHIMSAFELANGYSRPLGHSPLALPSEIFDAHDTLVAKRKLAKILHSKPTHDIELAVGDLVDIYVRTNGQKRGKWSSARSVLSFDRSAWTVTVPSAHGRTMSAAIEDVRPSIADDSFAALIRNANDQLDVDLSLIASHVTPNSESEDGHQSPTGGLCAGTLDPTAVPFAADYCGGEDITASTPNPVIGDRVEIHWPIDNAYYSGVVSSIIDSGQHVVSYDDGDKETLDLSAEAWRFCLAHVTPDAVPRALASDAPAVLSEMLAHFGNKPFLLHQAEGFPPYAAANAYEAEESSFKQTVRAVPIADIPHHANVIGSHTLYKVKVEDDHQLRLKARIAPHGNEDSIKADLRSDCSMCSPVGMRIILSTAALRRWRLTKLDVKTAFLQTGAAERDVYVMPPRESGDRGRCVWLLLTAAYGLINANAKWQVISDSILTDLGFRQTALLPQLFVLVRNSVTVAIVAKIVDDLLLAGVPAITDPLVRAISAKVELGTITHGPGHLRYFGLNLHQADDYTTVVDADDKLSAIGSMPISRIRRRELDSKLSTVESKAFASLNSTIGWLGITASPFCAAFASRHQQAAPSATIREFINQSAELSTVQALGSTTSFPRTRSTARQTLSVTVFSDAGRSATNGQLCYVAGLLLGDLRLGSIFHALSWSSHKSKRPVRSIGAAEILAAGEAIDEGKILAHSLSIVHNATIPLHIVLDSKDLFTSLSTKRNSIDKSIRADVNCIRYEFERRSVARIVWIPGKLNLADPGTKPDSPLVVPLQLTLLDGKLAHSFLQAESCDADRPLG